MDNTPYNRPTIPIKVKSPHIATSLVVKADVLVFFIVDIKTLDRITAPIVMEIIPDIIFILKSPFVSPKIFQVYKGCITKMYILENINLY